MKNGIEIRPNGVKITKKMGNAIPQYHVDGSANGPWDYLWSARRDADGEIGQRAKKIVLHLPVAVHTVNVEFRAAAASCDKVASNEKI